VKDLVVVEVVVPDLDAGLLLEVRDRVLADVVGPVVDVEDLLLLCRRGRGEGEDAGERETAEDTEGAARR
jgi:hypothetical protein